MFIEIFEEVGSAQASVVFWWEEEDGEAFRDVGFEPSGERWRGALVELCESEQFCIGFVAGA